jgi:hypothetical protein
MTRSNSVNHLMEGQPSLMREIGKVAWFFVKALAAMSAVVALLVWMSSRHPILGIIAFYCIVFAALIVYLGWQNYKSKLKSLETRRNLEADMNK